MIEIENCKHKYKYEDIMPIKTGKFETILMPIPSNTDLVLTNHYGKDYNNDIKIINREPKTKITPNETCGFHKTNYAYLLNA